MNNKWTRLNFTCTRVAHFSVQETLASGKANILSAMRTGRMATRDFVEFETSYPRIYLESWEISLFLPLSLPSLHWVQAKIHRADHWVSAYSQLLGHALYRNPRTMEALWVEIFSQYTECKIVYYSHRMARGVSIGSICLWGLPGHHHQSLWTPGGDSLKWKLPCILDPLFSSAGLCICW